MGGSNEASSLVRLARRDLNAMIGMQDSPLVDDAIIGFHAQQAVEKALKAWLSARGREYPLTHDLARLFELLDVDGAAVRPFWGLARFAPYAVQARYAERLPDLDEAVDRPALIAEVTAFVDHVAALIARLEA